MMTKKLAVLLSLASLYLIWGSTFLVIRVGVRDWPPLILAGFRFVLAGFLLFVWLWIRRFPLPTRRELLGSAFIGLLIPALGNGLMTMGETWVESGMAALIMALVPLFTTFFSRLFGVTKRVENREWGALCLGLIGLLILNSGHNDSFKPIGILVLLTAALFWALGSVLNRFVVQPKGLMSVATMMLCGGLELLFASFLIGERMTHMPSASGWFALGYLTVFGSIIAYSAYIYLLNNVKPALATSYSYVIPVIAVFLGAWLLHEPVFPAMWLGMGFVVSSVLLLFLSGVRS